MSAQESRARYRERNRDALNAHKRAVRLGLPDEPRPPFDDLELSGWTFALARQHLDPAQFDRMIAVLRQRVVDYRAREANH